MADGASYNPYRKANGEFASKDELGSVEEKVSKDLGIAKGIGWDEKAAEIEGYAMEKMPESELGRSLLEARYGAAAAAASREKSVEARYEELRGAYSDAGIGSADGRRQLGRSLETVADSDLQALSERADEQKKLQRPGLVWDGAMGDAVAVELRRRKHSESFAKLTELGYEHDGQGSYSKPDSESAKSFYVAARGLNGGNLVVREGREVRNISSEAALREAATGELSESRMKAAASKSPESARDELRAAGVSYPSNWSEMGSSAKDLWEERQLRSLQRSKPSA